VRLLKSVRLITESVSGTLPLAVSPGRSSSPGWLICGPVAGGVRWGRRRPVCGRGGAGVRLQRHERAVAVVVEAV